MPGHSVNGHCVNGPFITEPSKVTLRFLRGGLFGLPHLKNPYMALIYVDVQIAVSHNNYNTWLLTNVSQKCSLASSILNYGVVQGILETH